MSILSTPSLLLQHEHICVNLQFELPNCFLRTPTSMVCTGKKFLFLPYLHHILLELCRPSLQTSTYSNDRLLLFYPMHPRRRPLCRNEIRESRHIRCTSL
uniref:Uncharacterized protein n=1 Tax=Arundo donax TaxID=35708 RepID=A0A0A9BQP3_ARUDO